MKIFVLLSAALALSACEMKMHVDSKPSSSTSAGSRAIESELPRAEKPSPPPLATEKSLEVGDQLLVGGYEPAGIIIPWPSREGRNLRVVDPKTGILSDCFLPDSVRLVVLSLDSERVLARPKMVGDEFRACAEGKDVFMHVELAQSMRASFISKMEQDRKDAEAKNSERESAQALYRKIKEAEKK